MIRYPSSVETAAFDGAAASDAANSRGPPLRTVHRDCGADVRVNLVCDDGHQVDSPRTVVRRPGPRPMSSVRESTADVADARGGARRTVQHDDEAAIDHASSQHRRHRQSTRQT